ncbi:hypothetical protein [Pseudomonas sp. C5pp]|uniref:hypothetical protein n=1 Tax=Pseudomonas sp. C5pp TaxID=1586081 RepID=UPI001F1F4D62|nr:hypothetical protein [Pseudomonas sp. C5pp]
MQPEYKTLTPCIREHTKGEKNEQKAIPHNANKTDPHDHQGVDPGTPARTHCVAVDSGGALLDVHTTEAKPFPCSATRLSLYILCCVVLRLHRCKRCLLRPRLLSNRATRKWLRPVIHLPTRGNALFLISHAVSYTLVSVVYSSFFYFISKPLYGSYSLSELLYLTAAFYTSYLIFSCIGLAIAAMPIKFSTAGTLFSLLSFLMLLSGYLGTTQDELTHWSTLINPLHLSTRIITGEIPFTISFLTAFVISTAGLYATGKLFRIHPIWSRY